MSGHEREGRKDENLVEIAILSTLSCVPLCERGVASDMGECNAHFLRLRRWDFSDVKIFRSPSRWQNLNLK